MFKSQYNFIPSEIKSQINTTAVIDLSVQVMVKLT